jgi:hypothetical protein
MNDVNNYPRELNEVYNSQINIERMYDKINETAGKIKIEDEEHFFRNKINKAPATLEEMLNLPERERWTLLPPEKAAYHMNGVNGEFNLKFVSPDGHFEAVYDLNGNLVNSIEDMGTYNYIGPQNMIGHYSKDVDTFYTYGNTKNQGGSGFLQENWGAYQNIRKFNMNPHAEENYDNILKQVDPVAYQEKKEKELREERRLQQLKSTSYYQIFGHK